MVRYQPGCALAWLADCLVVCTISSEGDSIPGFFLDRTIWQVSFWVG